jgi:hypothetical protein
MLTIPQWFIPSTLGDLSLSPTKSGCVLTCDRLTQTETDALKRLLPKAAKRWGRSWLADAADAAYHGQSTIAFTAPIEKVAHLLAKALKPERRLVTAVRFHGGRMEEIVESTYADDGRAPSPAPPAPPPKAAVTVPEPTRGCPRPDFETAASRATRVLRTFLDADQCADWEQQGAFLTLGGLTEHRYLVISRESPLLARYYRQVIDLDDNERGFCLHDWTVPPAEEALCLHVNLSLPGHENYCRNLPE